MKQRRIKLLAVTFVLLLSGLWVFAGQFSPEQWGPRNPSAAADEIRNVSENESEQGSSKEGWNLPADAKQTKNPVSPTPESIAKGQALYKIHCLTCHGEKGDGKGPMAANLQQKPGNLTDAKETAKYTDGEFFWMITKGKLPMKSYEKTLTAENRWHVVNYIRTFAK